MLYKGSGCGLQVGSFLRVLHDPSSNFRPLPEQGEGLQQETDAAADSGPAHP